MVSSRLGSESGPWTAVQNEQEQPEMWEQVYSLGEQRENYDRRIEIEANESRRYTRKEMS